MTMAWVAVGVGVLGAGASIAGSNKQAKAAKNAAGLNMEQYTRSRADQIPYMQSGYGAMSKLNTLLGLSPNPNAPRMSTPMTAPPQGFAYNPNGGVDPRMQVGPAPQWNVPEANMGNLRLRQILTLRAQNGDRQAQAMLTGAV